MAASELAQWVFASDPPGVLQEISAGKKGIDFEAFAKHVRKDGVGKGPFMNVWEDELYKII